MTSAARKPVEAMTNAEAVAELRRVARACVVCGEPTVGLQCAKCRSAPRDTSAPTPSAPANPAVNPTPNPTPAPAVPVIGVRRVRLPWSMLVPDNRKYGVIEGRMLLTSEYRKAKEAARAEVMRQLDGKPPLTGDVQVIALVYLPNLSRRRDVANLTKLVHDALSGLVYHDDSQIADTRWMRCGVDVDAPRCELTITTTDDGE